MKKQVTNDIIPAKKTIRDIELPSRTKDDSRRSSKYSLKEDSFENNISIKQSTVKSNVIEQDQPIRIDNNSLKSTSTDGYKYTYEAPKRRGRSVLYAGVGVAIIFIAFILSSFFKSATIQIAPISQVKNLNENFNARKDDSSAVLDYQIVTVTKDLEKLVDQKDVDSEQKVERKAKGIIIIYNNSGATAQKLVATTRFETPEGLVFRLINAVTVPGVYTRDGKQVPGSVEAEVVSDQPGQNYNIGLKDFTLPGLKSDPAKYKTIYARSKTEMTGGFSGAEKVVNREVLLKIEKEMESTLKTDLANDVVNQIPSDFVLYPISLNYNFDPAMTVTTTSGATAIKKKGVVSAVIFSRKNLTKSILQKILPDADPSLIRISNLDTLEYSQDTSVSPTTGTITFNLKGEAGLVWIIDESKLKNDLLGLSKNNAKSVMSAYPSIKEAWVVTRPFWNNKIPTNPKRVTVVNTLEKDR